MNDDNPWGPASPAKELKEVSTNRLSYHEPSLSPQFPTAGGVNLPEDPESSPWESGSGTTYPPSAANPFNAPRTSALRTLETPKKNTQVRLAPLAAGDSQAETPLSSPGLDGPLTYSWQPKAEIVLGLAVVDFNHLASLLPVSLRRFRTKLIEGQSFIGRTDGGMELPSCSHTGSGTGRRAEPAIAVLGIARWCSSRK